MSSDKYPEETDRRRFVKGVVGGSALAGAGAAGVSTVNSLTNPTGVGGGVTEFYGIELLSGPAPRGMPQIPVEIDDEGYLRGVYPEEEEMDIAGVTYQPEWFQYCGVQTYPGVQPGGDFDNYFRYAQNVPYDWQNESVEPGDRMHVDDFSDYETWGNEIGDEGIGKPGRGSWRSQGLSPQETMPIEVIRSERIEEMASESDWLSASTAQGFVAYLDKCTHFCCVPGFKHTGQSEQYDAGNNVFCPCHQSIYDPFSVLRQSFVALPRPEGGGGGDGGGGNGGGGGGN